MSQLGPDDSQVSSDMSGRSSRSRVAPPNFSHMLASPPKEVQHTGLRSTPQKQTGQTATQIKNAEKAKRSRDALKAIKDSLEDCTKNSVYYEQAEALAGKKPKAGDSEGYKLQITKLVIELLTKQLEAVSRGATPQANGFSNPNKRKRDEEPQPEDSRAQHLNLNLPPPPSEEKPTSNMLNTSPVQANQRQISEEVLRKENEVLKNDIAHLHASWAVHEAALVARLEHVEELLEVTKERAQELKAETKELRKREIKQFMKGVLLVSQNTQGHSESQPIPDDVVDTQETQDLPAAETLDEIGRDLDFGHCHIAPRGLEGLAAACDLGRLDELASKHAHLEEATSPDTLLKTVVKLQARFRRHTDPPDACGSQEHFQREYSKQFAAALESPCVDQADEIEEPLPAEPVEYQPVTAELPFFSVSGPTEPVDDGADSEVDSIESLGVP